jgi:hypothetical protein
MCISISVLWCADGPGLLVLLALLLIGCAQGLRKPLAALALLDLLLPPGFMLPWLPKDPGGLFHSDAWAMLTFTVCSALVAALLWRRPLPDWFLPVRGMWARRLLAGLAIAGLYAVLLVCLRRSSFEEVLSGHEAAWWLLLRSGVLCVYFFSLWDVLVKGWNPKGDPPGGVASQCDELQVMGEEERNDSRT